MYQLDQIKQKETDSHSLDKVLAGLPELTLTLLSFISKHEQMSPIKVLQAIDKARQPGLDIVSAILVFLLAYIAQYLKQETNRDNFAEEIKRKTVFGA